MWIIFSSLCFNKFKQIDSRGMFCDIHTDLAMFLGYNSFILGCTLNFNAPVVLVILGNTSMEKEL